MAGADQTSSIAGQFRSTTINKVDAKKRVAIPAGYRALLNGQALVLRKSARHACIEAWPIQRFDQHIKTVSPHTDLDEDDELDLYANVALTQDAIPDTDGRIILDRDYAQYAGITDQVMFIGKGETFELWQPEAGQLVLDAAERRRRERAARPRAA